MHNVLHNYVHGRDKRSVEIALGHSMHKDINIDLDQCDVDMCS